ncbi:MAG: hypothetical protein AAFS03_10625, partial [Pseudomonadota bacterium]
YTSNVSILTDVCNGVGVTSARHQVVADVRWLSEVELVSLQETGDFIVVTARTRGIEVANGRLFVDGVKSPRPGA